MNLKKDDCILLFMSYNKQNENLLRELLKSGKKIRLAVDDITSAKKSFFDIWEKFEGVHEFNFTFPLENTKEKLKEMTKLKKGVSPNYVILISQMSNIPDVLKEEEISHIMSLDQTNFRNNFYILQFFSDRNNKFKIQPNKFIFISLGNQTKTIDREYSGRRRGNVNNWVYFRNFFGLLYEEMITHSGLNYFIVKSEEISEDIHKGITHDKLGGLLNEEIADYNLNSLNANYGLINNYNFFLFRIYNKIPYINEYRKFSKNRGLFHKNKNEKFDSVSIQSSLSFERSKLIIELGILFKLGSIIMKKLIH